MADVATQVADPSPAPAVEEHYEVPTDPAERAEWRLTGKVSPKKSQPSKDASAPSDKSADGTPSGKGAPVSETGKQTQERPRPNASDRKEELNREIRELLAKRDSLKGEIEGKSKPDVKDSSPAAAPAPSVPSELKAPAKPDYAKLRNDAKTWDEGEAAVESAREKYLEEMADFRAEQKFRNLQADQAKQAATREMQAKLTEATKRYGAEAGSTTGIVVEEWIKDKYDTEREMHLRRADESHYKVRINTPEPYTNDEGQQAHYPISADISHYVTVSTGPSYDSQRDSASQFGDLLVQNLETLPASPPQKAKLLSLVIRLKNLGPLGDEMAEIISPAPGDNLQQLQQAQAGLQQAQQLIQQLQQELQKLGMEKQAHVVEGEYRLQQEKLKSQTALTIEQLKIEAQTAAAEITTKSQQLGERIKFVEDVWKQLHGQAHDVAMQAHEQAADQQAAEQAAEAAAQQQQAQPDQSQPDQSQQETSPGPA